MSRKQLIAEYSKDVFLTPFFAEIRPEEEFDEVRVGYFDRDGILMRKWHSHAKTGQDDWLSVFQIVDKRY